MQYTLPPNFHKLPIGAKFNLVAQAYNAFFPNVSPIEFIDFEKLYPTIEEMLAFRRV